MRARWLIPLLLVILLVPSLPSPRRLWHYQLQGATEEVLKRLDLPYYVVDLYEFEGDPRRVPGVVLAYVSIGEVEDYRWYWEELPKDLVLRENPRWKGNYIVRFWDPRWKEIVLKMVEEAKRRGFDGVYLDRADVYAELDARDEMVRFVCQIHHRAKVLGLLVFVQNAEELYPDVRNCVDGIGKEDLWFNDDEPVPSDDVEYSLKFLRQALKEGKTVLVIDYPRDPNNVCGFYRRCFSEAFYCTVSNRELSRNEPVTCPFS